MVDHERNETNNGDGEPTGWEAVSEMEMVRSEPYEGSDFEANLGNDEYGFEDEDIPEDLPDGTPQILWRGERVYLGNIDQVGKRPLTTKGNERSGNGNGARLSTSRDKAFALPYAVGKDGVKFYDEPLTAEEIPIGVIYRINNKDNHLGMSSDDEVDGFFLKQQREYTTSGEIPPEDYEPVAFILMSDLKEPVQRSDFRMPLEVIPIDHKRLQSDPEYLEHVKTAVKMRHQQLADEKGE